MKPKNAFLLRVCLSLTCSRPSRDARSAQEAAAESATAAEAAAPDAAAPPAAPNLPPYFTGVTPQPGPNGKEQSPFWPDPTGGKAGTWATPSSSLNPDGSIAGDNPDALTPIDLYERIVHNLFSINVVWTLITGFLVMFMQAGFMLVETGLCRAKNASHTSHESA